MTTGRFTVRESKPADLVLSNPEAEKKVLGFLLHENSALDLVADRLDERDFADPLHARIFAVMAREIGDRRRVNPVLLAPMFKDDDDFIDAGGRVFLEALAQDVMFEVYDPAYAERVRDLAVQRRLVDSLRNVIEGASTPGADLQLIVADADTALTAAIERRDPGVLYDAGDMVDEVIAGFDRVVTGVKSGVVSGIDLLIGAIRPGWLGYIAGRPGMGKTAALISYLRGCAAQGHHVLLASLEMDWSTVSLRLLSDYCYAIGQPILFDRLLQNELQPHQQRQIRDIRNEVAKLPLTIVDKKVHTISQLRRAIRRQKRRLEVHDKKLSLVAVDYIQLLKPDRSRDDEFQDVTQVSRALAEMAGDEDVAILCLSQLSRAVEQRQDKRPMMSDLRSSGQLEQDADFIVMLYAEEYYLKKAQPASDSEQFGKWEADMARYKDVLEFICVKHRHGAEGVIHGRFFRPYQAVR
ncbi:AAA family ATPase [Rhizorhabdus wittichii]|uniref:DNA 5'-3' helicase n=1 Tax=Rhizorhabdus wittichii TaxID=160791 RepID=A0A975D352_9SPHN|nr:DnaB-like helicase C-terminal domain-containing protein [Rhizorhabdus wittichii]QTH21978.1 AAA family ATPase [Rhizorhabdus wittichii]